MDENDKTSEEGLKCSVDELIKYCRELPTNWLPTSKNVEFRYRTGLTIDKIVEYVKTLRKEYYQEEIDDKTSGHSGKMYVFKRLVEERYWCYIKIKINRTNDNKLVLVVSFHDDERVS